MANHVRRQIRDAATTALTGLATTGSRVHGYRVVSLQASQLPALSIYTMAEDAAEITIHAPAIIEREIDLRVKGMAVANADLDDTLDQISKEVETVLAAGLTIGSRSYPVHYRGCEMDEEAGEKKAGEIVMRFAVTVMSAANTPDVFYN